MTQPSNLHISDADLELLSAYIDNQLAGEERGALDKRLRDEPALRAALDELRATVVLLRELEPLVPPRSFTIDPQAHQPRRNTLFDRLNIGSALAALALTFLCVAVFVLRGALPGIRTGGNVASAPPAAPASGGSQALTLASPASGAAAAATAAPAAGAPAIAAEATAVPLAAEAPAAAEASTGAAAPEAAAGIAAQPTAGPSDATSARETDRPPEAANEAAAPTGQTAQDQQVAATATANVQPPIATSGSTAPGTGYLPPAAPVGAAGEEPPSPLALLRGPILVLSGLLLLLIIGLLWARRRR